jgi:L-Lysine epsilon oxidase N-terminal/L-lysine epsilon oxidase C-terminal domain
MSIGDEIESVAIYPSIGVARVGNSPDEFFFGPEVPGAEPIDPDHFRDRKGRIKRQAARFRLYGLDADGRVVREITTQDAEISWTVHIANTKAAWFQFDQAMDVPASKGKVAGVNPTVSLLRNPQVKLRERDRLVIDPGPRTIAGASTNAGGGDTEYAFDTGMFSGKLVYLGELRTDEAGRLVFLGGRGLSGSIDDVPVQPDQFANTPGWHDDIADGPVDAVVKLDGREFRAVGAWVLSAPPDYAPGVPALITGYDLIFEVATKLDPGIAPARPKFSEQIHPLLARFSKSQWVNAGFFREFGWGSPMDFSRPELAARLNDPGPSALPMRRAIFDRFRRADYSVMQADAWPGIYGDAVTLDMATKDPREWMAVLEIQYDWLRRWAEGDFEADGLPIARSWDDLSPAEQAAGLDRGVLDHTIGGPFHPGAEFTWPMRLPILYEAPFRIKRRNGPAPDLPLQLTSDLALAAGGPLDGSGPGDLTRWMACPWQTDTSSCLSAYRPYGGEYLPTFWPARVPNDVLTRENYEILTDPEKAPAEKEAAFDSSRRLKWLRGIVYDDDSYPPTVITDPLPTGVFVEKWWQVGIVTKAPGPGRPFPDEVWVETGRTIPDKGSAGSAPKARMLLWDQDPTEMR